MTNAGSIKSTADSIEKQTNKQIT